MGICPWVWELGMEMEFANKFLQLEMEKEIAYKFLNSERNGNFPIYKFPMNFYLPLKFWIHNFVHLGAPYSSVYL